MKIQQRVFVWNKRIVKMRDFHLFHFPLLISMLIITLTFTYHISLLSRSKKIKLWEREKGQGEVEWWWKSLPWHLEWCEWWRKGFNILSSSSSSLSSLSSSKWLIDESFWHRKRRERRDELDFKFMRCFQLKSGRNYFYHHAFWRLNCDFLTISCSALFQEFYYSRNFYFSWHFRDEFRQMINHIKRIFLQSFNFFSLSNAAIITKIKNIISKKRDSTTGNYSLLIIKSVSVQWFDTISILSSMWLTPYATFLI